MSTGFIPAGEHAYMQGTTFTPNPNFRKRPGLPYPVALPPGYTVDEEGRAVRVKEENSVPHEAETACLRSTDEVTDRAEKSDTAGVEPEPPIESRGPYSRSLERLFSTPSGRRSYVSEPIGGAGNRGARSGLRVVQKGRELEPFSTCSRGPKHGTHRRLRGYRAQDCCRGDWSDRCCVAARGSPMAGSGMGRGPPW